jgi:23S rRNA pseudouridine2605 synthase
VSPDPGGGLRINRFLAGRGLGSRRSADRMVEQGRVRVNHVIAIPGTIIHGGDEVTVDGAAVPPPVRRRTLMLNKPVGVVSTSYDPGGRPTVLDLVEDPEGLFTVGRLDADSRGLLLLTTDGELALRLTHPRHGVTKRYRVTVRGRAGARALRALTDGVELVDGPARALEAVLVDATRAGDVVEVVMTEGRRREVRRLFAALGITVADLERVAIGPLALGRLLEGASRPLNAREDAALRRAAGMPPAGRR